MTEDEQLPKSDRSQATKGERKAGWIVVGGFALVVVLGGAFVLAPSFIGIETPEQSCRTYCSKQGNNFKQYIAPVRED